MQVADIGFPRRRRMPREIADIAQRLEVIDRFKMIFQRLAANRNAVLDHHPRSAAVGVLTSIAFDV
jgi:hypothetical protein